MAEALTDISDIAGASTIILAMRWWSVTQTTDR